MLVKEEARALNFSFTLHSFHVNVSSRLLLRTSKKDVKHSFSLTTTSLIGGLVLEVVDTQAIAISIAFQAELTLKSPPNLGSTIF
ncbi:hypothetical protein CFP56_035428 [Quercus suber]|uniref:Uncharacterized protein n=1 Tax=Quercus suber TaxID=58331 RepID=A0AAW0J9H7_QUESU